MVAHRDETCRRLRDEVGLTLVRIGEIMGRDHTTIIGCIKRGRRRKAEGRPIPPMLTLEHVPVFVGRGRGTAEQVASRREKAVAYRKEGYSMNEIARLLGYRCHTSVRALLQPRPGAV